MPSSEIFQRIRSNTFGLWIRSHISRWPGYQQIPNPQSFDPVKTWVAAALSALSQTTTRKETTKKRAKETRILKASQNSPVLLIGNGPSSKSLTIEQIRRFKSLGGKVAVMNDFFKAEIAKHFEPDYYFVVDPEYWIPTYKNSLTSITGLKSYLKGLSQNIQILQPAARPALAESRHGYIFLDERMCLGLIRVANPLKPWGVPPSVALQALATLKYLGHPVLYFTGLDSNFVQFFKVNDLNEVVNIQAGQHFYSNGDEFENALEKLKIERNRAEFPFRHMADLYYAHGIFLRDFYWLTKDWDINVGNDESNDASPRAVLLS